MFVWKQPEVSTATPEYQRVQIILHTKLDGTINTMLEQQHVNTNANICTNTNKVQIQICHFELIQINHPLHQLFKGPQSVTVVLRTFREGFSPIQSRNMSRRMLICVLLLSPESVHGCYVPLLTFPTSQMTFNRFVKHPKSCISWFNLLDLQQFIGVLSTAWCGRTLIVAHLQFIHISANPPTNQPGSSK